MSKLRYAEPASFAGQPGSQLQTTIKVKRREVLVFLLWLRLVETLRTSSEQYEDYEFDDLAATVRLYEPSLAFSFDGTTNRLERAVQSAG